jgi:hypothetical protein
MALVRGGVEAQHKEASEGPACGEDYYPSKIMECSCREGETSSSRERADSASSGQQNPAVIVGLAIDNDLLRPFCWLPRSRYDWTFHSRWFNLYKVVNRVHD